MHCQYDALYVSGTPDNTKGIRSEHQQRREVRRQPQPSDTAVPLPSLAWISLVAEATFSSPMVNPIRPAHSASPDPAPSPQPRVIDKSNHIRHHRCAATGMVPCATEPPPPYCIWNPDGTALMSGMALPASASLNSLIYLSLDLAEPLR